MIAECASRPTELVPLLGSGLGDGQRGRGAGRRGACQVPLASIVYRLSQDFARRRQAHRFRTTRN